MSGRSAYVRKHKANYKEKSGPTSQPFQSHQSQPSFYQPPPPQYVQPEPRYDHYEYEYSGRHPPRRRSSSIHAVHPASASAYPDQPTYHRSPASSGATGIEKSSFRAFMDSRSDAFRTKLTSRFSNNKQAEERHEQHEMDVRPDQMRQPRSMGGSAAFELPASPMPMPMPMQESLPVRPRTQPRHDSSFTHESSLRGVEQAAPVKRWTGGGKLPHAWSKLRKVS